MLTGIFNNIDTVNETFCHQIKKRYTSLGNVQPDAIVTFAMHFDWMVLSVFIQSWWKYANTNSHLYIFVNNNPQAYALKFQEPSCADRLHILAIDVFLHKYKAAQVDRHLTILDFVEKNENKFRYIFLADCRDILIQGDPFRNKYLVDAETKNELPPVIFALEPATYGYQDANDDWIRYGFSDEALERMKNKTVSCSGTVLGPASSILTYLRGLVSLFKPKFRFSKGIDQGAHNYYIYEVIGQDILSAKTITTTHEETIRLADGTTSTASSTSSTSAVVTAAFPYVMPSNYDFIWTVGIHTFEQPEIFAFDEKRQILHMKNSTAFPEIVHQYDRFFLAEVAPKYNSSFFTPFQRFIHSLHYPRGSLVARMGEKAIFVMDENGFRHYIPNMDTLHCIGLTLANTAHISTLEMISIPEGSAVQPMDCDPLAHVGDAAPVSAIESSPVDIVSTAELMSPAAVPELRLVDVAVAKPAEVASPKTSVEAAAGVQESARIGEKLQAGDTDSDSLSQPIHNDPSLHPPPLTHDPTLDPPPAGSGPGSNITDPAKGFYKHYDLVNETLCEEAMLRHKDIVYPDAVVAFAMHFDWSMLAVLIQTWWKHSPTSRLYLFANRNPPAFQVKFTEAICSQRLQLVEIDITVHSLGPQADRYINIRDFLEKKGRENPFRYVFLSDARDVIIQGDIFKNHFFLEAEAAHSTPPVVFATESAVFGKQGSNDDWVRYGFGQDALDRMASKPISCSGTVIGPMESIMTYLRGIIALFKPRFGKFRGIDQGAHNYYLYDVLGNQTTKDFPFVITDNGNTIWTVGIQTFEAPDLFIFDPTTDLLSMANTSLSVPLVVHQYDRFYEAEVQSRYTKEFMRNLHAMINKYRFPTGTMISQYGSKTLHVIDPDGNKRTIPDMDTMACVGLSVAYHVGMVKETLNTIPEAPGLPSRDC